MGYSAFGTLLKIGDGGGPETFTTIGEVVDIGGPELGLDLNETTNHSSTAGYEEFVGGVLRTGEVTLTINYLPTNATHNNTAGLIRDQRQKTKRNFQLVFTDPSNTTWTFGAFVTRFRPNAPHNEKLSADVTLKVSGQPTLA